MNKYSKAILTGLGGALVMFIFIALGTFASDFAPYNVPPSKAFLMQLGLGAQPVPIIVHFLYGALGSVVVVAFFGTKINWRHGMSFALLMWLIMMLVYSPIIGWGVFGLQPEVGLSEELMLGSGTKYILSTLVLHVLYGLAIGFGNEYWINERNVNTDTPHTAFVSE